jgi:hypothetical protein
MNVINPSINYIPQYVISFKRYLLNIMLTNRIKTFTNWEKMKKIQLLFGLAIILMISGYATAADVDVTRYFSTSTLHAGDTLDVTLHVAFIPNVSAIGIREYVPVGWGISLIDAPNYSSYDETTGSITYILYQDELTERDLVYTLRVPDTVLGPYGFNGTVEYTISEHPDSFYADITGSYEVVVETEQVIPDANVTRYFSNPTIYRGGTLDVVLEVDVNPGVTDLVIVEWLPVGWEINLIDPQSNPPKITADKANGTIIYVFNGDEVMDMNLTYSLRVAQNAQVDVYDDISGSIVIGTGGQVPTEKEVAGDITYYVAAPTYACFDSDGGRNYKAKGTIYSVNLGTKTDTCKNTKNLIEYYCKKNKGYSVTTKCPYGCINGACRQKCDDHKSWRA